MHLLIVKSRAILMIKDAYDWYEKQKGGLGEEFLVELDLVFSKIESAPSYYGKIKGNFRQAVLKRFPYLVVYKIIRRTVIVFAVFHTKRNPKFKFGD
jgi:hypothetical protein